MAMTVLLLTGIIMDESLASQIAELSTSDAARRAAAAERLCRLGEAAQAASVALVRASGDDEEQVREWAVAALEDLGPPRAEDQQELARLATFEDSTVAYWAVTLVGRLGADASASIDALALAAANHPATIVRQRAVWAIGQTGSQSAKALEVLRLSAQSDDARLARLAQRALDKLEKPSAP